MNKDQEKKPMFSYEELAEKYLYENKKKNKQDSSITNEEVDTKVDEPSKFTDDNKVSLYRAYISVIVFITTIILTSFGAAYLGSYLDDLMGTAPLFIILFALIGVFASFRNLFVSLNVFGNIKKENQKDENHDN